MTKSEIEAIKRYVEAMAVVSAHAGADGDDDLYEEYKKAVMRAESHLDSMAGDE